MKWSELFARAEVLRSTVLAEAWNQEKPLLLQPATRPGSLLLLATGLLWPFEVILDEKNLLPEGEAFRLDESLIPTALMPTEAWIEGDAGASWPWARFEEWRLTLCTSGSTGEPKRIQKSGAGLWAEVRDLAALYQWTDKDSILSLVSPLHIYGLLHSFLLPWFCQASVEFVGFQNGPVDPHTLRRKAYAGVVAVPATWSFVKDLLAVTDLGSLVMSGAPFGEKRRAELRTLQRKPENAWEILGSTETGGIGFRSLLGDDEAFRPMPSVTLTMGHEGQWVESPYLHPASRWLLADQLEVRADGSFVHCGRTDRIFKYAGQRYALAEVERALSAVYQNAESFARFHADAFVAQGGWIEAWVEMEAQKADAADRQSYQQKTRAPFPHVLHFLPRFPRDAQGKLQLARTD